ncbi:phenylacetic acid degradation protein, partial [Klebsiella pneumoniae]|nr:phenylacetic acid degradation protein [Klebsiella pneumoniae]
GITPILSLIKTTLAAEPQSRFTLVYGNRSVDSIIVGEALEDLKDRYLDRFALYHVLSRQAQDIALFNGRLDGAKARAF